MKKLFQVIALAMLALSGPFAVTACQQAPTQRVVQVQTLKAVGQSADAAVALSAQLYRDGRITPAQARQVMDFYDLKFQPAYRVAVYAVQGNLDSFASPDVAGLATQLIALVAQYQSK